MSEYSDALQKGNTENQRRIAGTSWDTAEYVNATEEELMEYQFQTLVGFCDELGRAWHDDATRRGDAEDNHYPGAIPLEDIRRRLFNWQADEAEVYVKVRARTTVENMDGFDEVGPYRMVLAPGRKGIVRSDNDHTMGVFKSGYTSHQYDEWLTKQIENLLDDGLAAGSASVLKQGAVAAVQIRLREEIATQDGMILPYLLATTSFDGSVATTYKRCVTRAICRNTIRIAKAEKGAVLKIKHTANSNLKLDSARQALGLIEKAAEDYIAAMDALLAIDVTNQQFAKIIENVWPMPKEEGRGRTMTETRWGQVMGLWNHDERVKPVAGTAWGVVNAFNTWSQHIQSVRGKERDERNLLSVIDGSFDSFDAEVLGVMEKVLVRA